MTQLNQQALEEAFIAGREEKNRQRKRSDDRHQWIALLAKISIIIILIIMALLGYGCWIVTKKINYYLSYESQVHRTIEESIKPECIKDATNEN